MIKFMARSNAKLKVMNKLSTCYKWENNRDHTARRNIMTILRDHIQYSKLKEQKENQKQF